MEKYKLESDLKVFGRPVKTFPIGIGEAFDELLKTLPKGDERTYYGISQCTNGTIIYIAAALETFAGEGKKYGYENYSIEKGDYLTATLIDWTSKTNCIKDVFEELGNEGIGDNTKPFVEMYKNMKEMMCMVKIDPRKEVLPEFDTVLGELLQTLSSITQQQLNTVPFQGSWTAGQLAEHLILSNSGFAQIINGPVKETERAPDEKVKTIKANFLDFTAKAESPDFVKPKNIGHKKEELLHSLQDIKATIKEAIQTLDLSKTCLAFEIPVYGFLTRLEAMHFVIYHTQRHLQQLKNIVKVLNNKVEYHPQ